MSAQRGDAGRYLTDLRDRTESHKAFHHMKQQIAAMYGEEVLGRYEYSYHDIPARGPILSENASVDYWNSILEGLANVYGEYGGSLKGVIILHGTDTMSYIAPLLLFRSQNLTFPIILTGANLAPSIAEDNSLLDVKTDAWENIYGALLFINQYGDVAPGVYVSFASRICLPLNLRKVRRQATRDRTANSAEGKGISIAPVLEPTHLYRFENINLAAPYLARIIDGEVVMSSVLNRLQSVYGVFQQGGAVTFKKVHVPKDSCFLLKVSPAIFPQITDSNWEKSGKLPPELAVAIFEGYKSGTLPTRHENSIRNFCLSCRDHGIPVVLTNRYGLHETEYGSTEDLTFLFRPEMMISETVLAAAYHVVDGVIEEESRREDIPDLQLADQRRLMDRRSHGIEHRLKNLEALFSSLRLIN
jgi:hypothetical protein